MHKLDKAGIFSDAFAQRENFITGIDARLKIGFTVAALIINLLAISIFTPLTIAAFCLLVLKIIKVPNRPLASRLVLPLTMAGVVLVTQLFLYGNTPLITISLGNIHLIAYKEGLAHGLLIMSRVIAGVSLTLLLSMSTPTNKLFMAAVWFKAPPVLVELALLIYRYVFLLLEEVGTMIEAQRVRLGYKSWRQSARSVSTLGACLILRAYARGERVFESMSARGYKGYMTFRCEVKPCPEEVLACIGLSAMLFLFYFVGLLGQ